MPAADGLFIAIELALVFGGALAFGWWQLRDLDRERRASAQRQQQQPAAAQPAAGDTALAAAPSQAVPPAGDTALVEPPCRSCTDPRVG